MNNKSIYNIKNILFFLALCMTIFITYLYVIRRPVVEPMVFTGNNIKKAYSKYNIKINTSNKTLTKGEQTISYDNYTNSLMSLLFAMDKRNVNELLSSHNLPVCKQMRWVNELSNKENLKLINKELKYPLVIKPQSGEKGTGVLTDIRDNDMLVQNIHNLLKQNINQIIIEEQTIGEKYRIFIVNQRIIFMKHENIPIIIGDGKSTIRQLIKQYPDIHKTNEIKYINENLIKEQGYKIDSVLENSKEIRVTNVISPVNGSSEIMVDPAKINEENTKMFIDVSKTLKLNLCGIDYVTPDLNTPYTIAGNIIEVNSCPGISEKVLSDTKIEGALIDALFSPSKYQ